MNHFFSEMVELKLLRSLISCWIEMFIPLENEKSLFIKQIIRKACRKETTIIRSACDTAVKPEL